jgi:hypothetical protein
VLAATPGKRHVSINEAAQFPARGLDPHDAAAWPSRYLWKRFVDEEVTRLRFLIPCPIAGRQAREDVCEIVGLNRGDEGRVPCAMRVAAAVINCSGFAAREAMTLEPGSAAGKLAGPRRRKQALAWWITCPLDP